MSVTSVPYEIVQGTTVSWSAENSEYPATSGYVLTYVFRSARQDYTITGSASGGGWTVTLPKATTAAMYPGVFAWQAFIRDSGSTVRYDVASGIIDVKPDLAATQTPPIDARSPARKRLDAFNDLLTTPAFIKTLEPGQISELELIRKQAEWDVKREADAEKLRAGGYPTRKILTRFA